MEMWNRTEPIRLNDVFPEWLTGGGIFSTLQEFSVPWQDKNISGELDLVYHGGTSGDKIISPLVRKVKSGDALTETEKTLLATSILAIYGANWGKQWATMSVEYSPIENYRMVERMTNDETVAEYGKSTTRTDNLTHGKTGTETVTIDETDTRTDNLTHGKTGTEEVTSSKTETTTPNLTTNTTNSFNGFNSVTAVPAGSESQTATGTNSVSTTGDDLTTHNTTETDSGTQTTVKDGENATTYNTTETDTGTQATVKDGENATTYNTTETDSGTQTIRDSGSDTHTRNYELTRSGNIGVTTSQQMIESERMLWIWNFFRDVVFPDVDRILTLQIY